MKKMFLNYEMSMKTSNAYVVPRMIVIDVDVENLMMTGSDPEYGAEVEDHEEEETESDPVKLFRF